MCTLLPTLVLSDQVQLSNANRSNHHTTTLESLPSSTTACSRAQANHRHQKSPEASSQNIQRPSVSSLSSLSPISSSTSTPQIRQTPVLVKTFTNSLRNGHNETRRGLHFDSSAQIADLSSEGEYDEPIEDDLQHENRQCCQEQWLENKALRSRLQKLHRRFNVAYVSI